MFLAEEVAAHVREHTVLVGEYQNIISDFVAFVLISRQLWVPCAHRSKKPLLVNKGKQSNTLPSKLLAIQINWEVFRVELDDVAVGFGHQVVERLGTSVS